MSPRRPDVSEQVLQFAPKEKTPRNPGDELDQAGQAIVGLLQPAANFERPMRTRYEPGAQAFDPVARRRGSKQTLAG